MIQKYLLVSCLLFSATIKADLIAEISQQAENTECLSGSFKQVKQIRVLPLPLHSTGTFIYEKNKKLAWNTLEPTQDKLEINLSSQKDESVSQAGQFVSELLAGLFTGQFDLLARQFEITPHGTIENWHLELQPKSIAISNSLKKIDLFGKQIAEKIYILNTNGDSTEISFDIQRTSKVNPAQ